MSQLPDPFTDPSGFSAALSSSIMESIFGTSAIPSQPSSQATSQLQSVTQTGLDNSNTPTPSPTFVSAPQTQTFPTTFASPTPSTKIDSTPSRQLSFSLSTALAANQSPPLFSPLTSSSAPSSASVPPTELPVASVTTFLISSTIVTYTYSPVPPTATLARQPTKIPLAALICAILGGVIGFLLIVLLGCFLRRRRIFSSPSTQTETGRWSWKTSNLFRSRTLDITPFRLPETDCVTPRHPITITDESIKLSFPPLDAQPSTNLSRPSGNTGDSQLGDRDAASEKSTDSMDGVSYFDFDDNSDHLSFNHLNTSDDKVPLYNSSRGGRVEDCGTPPQSEMSRRLYMREEHREEPPRRSHSEEAEAPQNTDGRSCRYTVSTLPLYHE